MKYDYSKLTGKVVTKETITYEEDREAWNRAIEKFPLVIIYCINEKDISNSIAWARNYSLEIRIRSGRHHYEGYSTGNDVVVIDISNMNNIIIDKEKNIVKIQGGVRNREIYEALGELGYPFPGGGCPTVGVTGLALGGGWGYSSRLFGLTADSMLELEMIDFCGHVITASENTNEDLFWACRGAGGGNFGVISSMTFKLPQKIRMATLINIDYIKAETKDMIKIIEIWMEFFKDLDRRINLKMAIYNSKEKGIGIKITGMFYGKKEEADEILSPFKSIFKNGVFDLDDMTALEALRIIQNSHPAYEKYKSSGRFVYNDFHRNTIEEIIKLVDESAEGATYAAVSFYGLGGAVKDKGKEETAFYYRDANFIIGLQSVWEDSKFAPKNIEWVKHNLKYISSITTGAYVNFPSAELKDYEKEYFGFNADKLKEIKRRYDPFNVFNFPQGIRI
ncbi:FAD-binding oxidoreductase [Clostridium sp. C2-6-12]|uniref:FAD-binding oxidoreductase n=1 Tax=Clostridium sp. C2-6-12 TaxID=2698832 RepID=UPI0013697407|nr:FAD-binding oxidoreductase [Clostridium sp. C2-6-12]